MPRLSINDIPMEFRRGGSGPPVVLVHGLGGPAMWERVQPILAAGHDVVLPHLPGFGDTPPAAAPLTVRGHAGLLIGMLGELGIRGAVVAGMSYGGEIAATIAAEAAASGAGSADGPVKALVLVGPTGTRRFPRYLRGRYLGVVLRPLLRAGLSNRRVAEELSRKSFHDISARPDGLVERYLEHLGRPGRLEALVSAIEELREHGGELPGLLERVRVPVTIVRGEDDRTIRTSIVQELLRARPDADVHVLPGCGHSAALEKPRELARIIAGAAARPNP